MKENEMVFGIRAVIEAIQADKEVDKILVKRDLQGDLSKELFEVLRGREIPVQRVPAERLDRLTRKNHQGVIAFMSATVVETLQTTAPTSIGNPGGGGTSRPVTAAINCFSPPCG